MSDYTPRVAFFTDAYNEVDGVANTAHRFDEYARRREFPLLTIHGGYVSYCRTDGSVTTVEYKRGWPSFRLDEKHDFDLCFWRHLPAVKAAVAEFRPDLIHITGPSDVGMLGVLVAHQLRIPLVASWHTNLHEYAALRAAPLLRWLPAKLRAKALRKIEAISLRLLIRYYRIPRLLFAPNPELIALLERGAGKPCFPMGRGVDLDLFNPQRRDRNSGPFIFGYVGRLTAEKNIHLLARLEQILLDAGHRDFRFLIVGQGAAQPWLRQHMRQADFAGVLRGDALGRAYANMDAFVFPSESDTFGNVVLEALAAGVPAVVANAGGPRFVVRHGQTGFVAEDEPAFARHMAWLLTNPDRCREMARAARSFALSASWDAVFDSVYATYGSFLAHQLPQQVSDPPGPEVQDNGQLMRKACERG
jgi:phosphatidylinositol alpha 1,6-mannosyltransferase